MLIKPCTGPFLIMRRPLKVLLTLEKGTRTRLDKHSFSVPYNLPHDSRVKRTFK